jgi:hypothetical protein
MSDIDDAIKAQALRSVLTSIRTMNRPPAATPLVAGALQLATKQGLVVGSGDSWALTWRGIDTLAKLDPTR